MKKLVLKCSIILTCFLTTVFLFISVDRLTMDNEEGVYFDEATLTTYNSQAQIFWVGGTIVSLLLTIVLVSRLKKLS